MSEENEQVKENTENNTEETEATPSTETKERGSTENLRVLENIEVKLTVEVGSTEIKIRDLLRLNEGSVVELDRLAGDPLDILANGTTIAKGEVVMVGERFGIRFTEVADPEERARWDFLVEEHREYIRHLGSRGHGEGRTAMPLGPCGLCIFLLIKLYGYWATLLK